MTESYTAVDLDTDVPLTMVRRKNNRSPRWSEVALVTGRKATELLNSGRYERVDPKQLPPGITTRQQSEIIRRYIDGLRHVGTVSTIWGYNWGAGPAAGVSYGSVD